MTCFIQKVLKASLLGEMFVLPSEVIRIIVIEFKPSRVFSIIPLYYKTVKCGYYDNKLQPLRTT